MSQAFPSSGMFYAFNNLIAFFPPTVHFNDRFRRMLQITIHNHGTFSPGFSQPCKDCGFLSKISGKMNSPDEFISFGHFLNFRPSPIFRPIIYKNQFELYLFILQQLSQSFSGPFHHHFFIICR